MATVINAANVNLGSQIVTTDFKMAAKGYAFNQLLRGIIKPGVYKGLSMSIVSGNQIAIAPGTFFLNGVDITRAADNIAVKVQTQSAIISTVNQTTAGNNEIVYIVYDYIEQIQDWASFVHDDAAAFYAARPINSIVIGEIIYDGGGNITGFEYFSKDIGTITDSDVISNEGIIYFDPYLKKDTVVPANTTAVAVGSLDLTYADLDLTYGDLLIIGDNDYQAQIDLISTDAGSLDIRMDALEGYFTAGVANNANLLDGMDSTTFIKYGLDSGETRNVEISTNNSLPATADRAALDIVNSKVGGSLRETTGVYGAGADTGVYGNGNNYGVYGNGNNYGVVGAGADTGVVGIGADTGVYGNGVTYDFYADGSGTNYGPFTGGHEITIQSSLNPLPGMLLAVEYVRKRIGPDGQSSLSSTFPHCHIAGKDDSVFCAFSQKSTLPEGHWGTILPDQTYAIGNALGEGWILATDKDGIPLAGDMLVTGDLAGYAHRLDPDVAITGRILKRVVGRVLQTMDWSDAEVIDGGPYKRLLIPVIYNVG